jgi:hypothetical protein
MKPGILCIMLNVKVAIITESHELLARLLESEDNVQN